MMNVSFGMKIICIMIILMEIENEWQIQDKSFIIFEKLNIKFLLTSFV